MVALAAPLPVAAQSAGATFAGLVVDSLQRPIENADIPSANWFGGVLHSGAS